MPSRRDYKSLGFAGTAVSAYERTYSTLFDQAHIEADRLEKINRALRLIENQLLDEDRIAEMDVASQIALADLLTKNSTSTVNNLTKFATIFMNVRNVVGLLDGIQKHTAVLPEATRKFPSREGRRNREFPRRDDD